MKTLYISLFILIVTTAGIPSNECTFYYPTTKGIITETTYYNGKGKPTGSKMYIEVSDISDSAGFKVEKIHTWVMSKDVDTAVSDFSYRVMCKGDKFYMDMSNYLDQNKLEAYRGMDMEVKADNISIPTHPVSGQKLDDGHVYLNVYNQGIKMISMTISILNRKVDAIEKITTPAGTFDAVKISYDIETKMGLTFKAKGIQWYAKGVGIVRTESYNKKGTKLQSYDEITKITKK